MPNALIHHFKDELQAKFSMEFCMAILLLEGRQPRRIHRCRVQPRRRKAMIERVDFVIDDSRTCGL